MGTSCDNEIGGGELFLFDGNGVGIEDIGKTAEANGAGFFVFFAIIGTGVDSGAKFTGNHGWEIKGKLLITKFGVGIDFGVGVGGIESGSVGNIEGVKIRTTEIATFD